MIVSHSVDKSKNALQIKTLEMYVMTNILARPKFKTTSKRGQRFLFKTKVRPYSIKPYVVRVQFNA